MKAAEARAALKARFRTGLIWNVAGALMTQGASFLAGIIVARIVGRDDYGAYAIVSSTIITAAGMAQLATGFTVTKFVAEFRHTDPLRAARIASLCRLVAAITGIAATLAIVFGSKGLAGLAFGEPTLAPLLLYAGGYILFAVMAGVQQGALAGCEAFKSLAQINLAHGAIYIIVCVVGTQMFGVSGALVALSTSAAIRWALLCLALPKVWSDRPPVSPKEALAERQVLIHFAIPAALSGIVSMSALWVGNAVLVNGQQTLGDMALFGAALSLKTLILFVPTLVDNVGATLLNSARGAGNALGFRQVLRINVLATGAVAAAMALATVLLARQLIGLFGAEFVPGANVLRVLAVAACVQALANTLYQVVQSEGRMWFSLLAVCIPRDAAMVILAFALVPHAGAMGLAMAHGGAAVIGLLVLLSTTTGITLIPRATAVGERRA